MSLVSNLFASITTSKAPLNSDLVAILRLIRSDNVGAKTFQSLIKIYGSAKSALEALPDLYKRSRKSTNYKIYSASEAEDEIANTHKLGGKVISYLDPEYPFLLKNIDDYPPIISIHGIHELLQKQIIAIVGSRNSSMNGRLLAGQIAETLGYNNIVVASGLARGIDTACHKASINSGTIAVIAGGLGHIYPAENTKLYHEITERGVIIAELATGSVPRSQHFPQRNRIISGISLGTVVVEATIQSGSLITAKFALEQNREVFAVPGFPLDPRCQGTNKLIKQGAILVDKPETIIENLPNQSSILSITEQANDNYHNFNYHYDEVIMQEARSYVKENLSSTPISLETLSKESSLPLQYLLLALVELELTGHITRSSPSSFILCFENQ